jgi:hypothetical protein
MSTVDQKLVQQLFEKVQAQKAEISKAEKPNWMTNCSFGYDEASSTRLNLKTISDTRELTKILAFILSQEKFHTEANSILGIETEFNWLGFTKDAWVNDIKARVSTLLLGKKKKDLENYELRLNSLVSKEVRDQMELEAIMKALN